MSTIGFLDNGATSYDISNVAPADVNLSLPFGKILQDCAFLVNPSECCLLGKSFRMLPFAEILQDFAFWDNPSGVFAFLGESFRNLYSGTILQEYAF